MRCVMKTVRRLVVWICRFRHRCGYGIHSPFAFALVTGVVYERNAYYAYDSLRQIRRTMPSSLRERDDRLLFRLANVSEADTIVVCGENTDLTCRYLQAARTHARILPLKARSILADWGRVSPAATSVDFLYIDAADSWLEAYRQLLPVLGKSAMVVVRGIHGSAVMRRAWRTFTADEHVRVTFDLYDFGIACLEQRFNKENYIINYL